jgi:hypothetical protein
MHIGLTRAGLFSLGLLLMAGLAGCTTAEGTNAMTDFGTFEREVMTSTARGVGLVPGETPKADLTQARAPLVLPKDASQLPPPTVAMADQLPVDSNAVQIDASNLSEADLARLRNARVVDMRTIAGRPLTEVEAKQLTARMQAANVGVTGTAKRPLYLPPADYFTRVGNADLVCRAPNGSIVPLNDAACPEDVRKAIKAAMSHTVSTPSSSGGSAGMLEDSKSSAAF